MSSEKSILIVSRSFYPMNSPRSFRTTELVKEFSNQGHKVTLYTLKDNDVHQKFEEEYGVTIKDLGNLKLPNINTSSNNILLRLFKRFLRRGLYQLFEYPDIELMWKVRSALKKESGYDLLITIAVPHPIHWGTAWAKTEKHPIADTWIADCGDPYMGSNMDTFRKMFYFKYFEKAFCRKADFITVPIEEAVNAYYSEFRNKIRVVPQGFNFEESKEVVHKYQPNKIPTFAYAGALMPGTRDPRPFLEYLVTLKKPYKFVIYTRDKHLVEPYVSEGFGVIETRDYIPRKELLQELSMMDFLINFENSSSVMMPSKLIDYFLTGRPVLSVPNNGINKKAINKFLNRDYSARVQYKNMERFKIGNVCQNFLDLHHSR